MAALRNFCRKLLLLSLAAVALPALADPVYSLTFLPRDFFAAGINNAGHVVGTSGGGAAIWSGSGVTYLAALAPGSEGLAINNRDEVAGRVGDHGFLYTGGVVRDIDSTPYRSWASGINDSGRVAGTVRENDTSPTLSRGFVYVDGAGMSTMLTFGGYVDVARAINSAGQVAGFASSPTADFGDPERNAFLYLTDGNVRNLGSLGGAVSEAYDLNDAAQVVGWSTTALAGEERPFLYDGSAMIDLGSLGGSSGRAFGINNGGSVVGISDVGGAAGFDYHAFLYAQHTLVDLNTLIDPAAGWRLVSATDINDMGQILGTACQVGGSDCLQVRLDMIPGVPEPGAWTMLLAGLALLGLGARRARRLVLLPLLAMPLAALADPVYTMTFLPADFQAAKMNSAGRVVGTYGGAAAIWSNTGITDIGAVAPGSFGRAINNRGDIGGDFNGDAFAYATGILRNIGQLGISDSTYLTALNDAGQMTGNAYFGIGERWRGFVYSDGLVRNIPTFGGDWSWTVGINSSGQVAGTSALLSTSFDGPHHAFLYQGGVARDIGTLGGEISDATAINDAGQLVGYSDVTPGAVTHQPHPFLYENGIMRDLGSLGGANGRALGINSAGQVVGVSEWTTEPQEFFEHAFLYADHAMVDLNSLIDPASGWMLTAAQDINDAGQILATACRTGECATVRLDLAVAAVPEPRAWGLLLVGLMLVASRRRASSAQQTFR